MLFIYIIVFKIMYLTLLSISPLSLKGRAIYQEFCSCCLSLFEGFLAGRQLFILTFSLLLFCADSCSAAPSRHFDVFYGGFAIAGNTSDFEAFFPHINRLSRQKDAEGHNAFQEKFRRIFKSCAGTAPNFSLRYDGADDFGDQKVLAFAFTDERVSVEKVGGSYKCCINFGADLLILDFETMKVVGCEPIIWEIIDVFEGEPTDLEIDDVLVRFMDSDEYFKQPLVSAFSKLSVRDFSRASMGVVNITVEEEALPFLPEVQRDHLDGYKRWMANQYKSFLSSELNVAVLPYGEKGGAVTIRMADRFVNTERLNFKIEPPTYGIDLSLIRFKQVRGKETAAERLLIYGVYIHLKVHGSKFDEIIKKGLPKIVPQSVSDEEIDDFAAYQETLKNLFLKSTEVMQKDRTFRKKVLKQCEIK